MLSSSPAKIGTASTRCVDICKRFMRNTPVGLKSFLRNLRTPRAVSAAACPAVRTIHPDLKLPPHPSITLWLALGPGTHHALDYTVLIALFRIAFVLVSVDMYPV